MSLAAWCDEYLAQIHVGGGAYVLQETIYFPHSVDLKAVAEAKEGKVRFGPRSASVCAVYLRKAPNAPLHLLVSGERSSQFCFSWNSDGESSGRSTLAGGHVFLCWKGMQRDGGFRSISPARQPQAFYTHTTHPPREMCRRHTSSHKEKPDAFHHSHTHISYYAF